MDWLRRRPDRPYLNLLFATLGGVPAGALVFAVVWMAVGEFNELYPRWMPLADLVPISLIAYPAAALVMVAYAMPLLWIALRLRFAGPAVALVAAGVPLLAFGIPEPPFHRMDWLIPAMTLGCGVLFVLLAYRRAPAPIEVRS